MRYTQNPKSLGVTYERTLNFGDHAANVSKAAKNKARALVHLAGSDWGYLKPNLRSTYLAIGRSTLDYAGAAWQPWLSKTVLEKLERTQRFAGRNITGQLKTTPAECELLEANLRSVSSKCHQNAVRQTLEEKPSKKE